MRGSFAPGTSRMRHKTLRLNETATLICLGYPQTYGCRLHVSFMAAYLLITSSLQLHQRRDAVARGRQLKIPGRDRLGEPVDSLITTR